MKQRLLQVFDASAVLLSCSDREAQNYGIFLREVILLINRWQVEASHAPQRAVGAIQMQLRRLQPVSDASASRACSMQLACSDHAECSSRCSGGIHASTAKAEICLRRMAACPCIVFFEPLAAAAFGKLCAVPVQVSQAVYNAECPAAHAFPNLPAGTIPFPYNNYHVGFTKLQYQLTAKLLANLKSTEWVHINNTLTVLKKLIKVGIKPLQHCPWACRYSGS